MPLRDVDMPPEQAASLDESDAAAKLAQRAQHSVRGDTRRNL